MWADATAGHLARRLGGRARPTAQVTEEALQYDVQYVTEHLLGSVGWAPGAAPAAARSAAGASGRLRTAVPRTTYSGTLTAALTGIAVDQLRDLVHGMSQTGYVVSWNSSGQVRRGAPAVAAHTGRCAYRSFATLAAHAHRNAGARTSPTG